MSFEKHHIVAPFLAVYKNGHSGFESKEALYEGIAKALQAKLQEYEETAALTRINHYEVAKMNVLYKLSEATKNDDRDGVTVYSQALQRI
jgi:hypothetical protein